ncbi:hypothetical protein EVAR_31260_1 [Eumeta japonica]|uniref:Uncharacterized protein n=1 Tax=Eumeta variegata TaxID=151549 RepID=A0A4C1W2S0_EUMVA|nr:hypothetical protein EVAR_31260_1 [Eumeta japonica]
MGRVCTRININLSHKGVIKEARNRPARGRKYDDKPGEISRAPVNDQKYSCQSRQDSPRIAVIGLPDGMEAWSAIIISATMSLSLQLFILNRTSDGERSGPMKGEREWGGKGSGVIELGSEAVHPRAVTTLVTA